jgi:hypothetical protein
MKMKRRVGESEGWNGIEPGPKSSVGCFPCNKSKHVSPGTVIDWVYTFNTICLRCSVVQMNTAHRPLPAFEPRRGGAR